MADAGGAHVDWQLVEDELRRVGRGEFDSVSFDSLPHVLSLLNESDLEVRLEQVWRPSCVSAPRASVSAVLPAELC